MKRTENYKPAFTDEEGLYENLTQRQQRLLGVHASFAKHEEEKSIDRQYTIHTGSPAGKKANKSQGKTKGSGRKSKGHTQRVLLPLIAGMFASLASVAQQGLQLGVQGVPQLSWLMNSDDKDNSDFEYRTTFNGAFGITSQYGFTDNLGIGLDAMYSIQGQRYKLDGTEYYRRVDYVKIPLMLVYTSELTSSVLIMGKIGPQLDLLTDARLMDKDGKELISDQKAAYMNYDVAGVAMLGAGFMLSDNLLLETSLRYDFGFTDAEDKDYDKNINDADAPGDGIDNNNRAVTNNMTAGVNVGLRYVFGE